MANTDVDQSRRTSRDPNVPIVELCGEKWIALNSIVNGSSAKYYALKQLFEGLDIELATIRCFDVGRPAVCISLEDFERIQAMRQELDASKVALIDISEEMWLSFDRVRYETRQLGIEITRHAFADRVGKLHAISVFDLERLCEHLESLGLPQKNTISLTTLAEENGLSRYTAERIVCDMYSDRDWPKYRSGSRMLRFSADDVAAIKEFYAQVDEFADASGIRKHEPREVNHEGDVVYRDLRVRLGIDEDFYTRKLRELGIQPKRRSSKGKIFWSIRKEEAQRLIEHVTSLRPPEDHLPTMTAAIYLGIPSSDLKELLTGANIPKKRHLFGSAMSESVSCTDLYNVQDTYQPWSEKPLPDPVKKIAKAHPPLRKLKPLAR
jgi:hypothetical protein